MGFIICLCTAARFDVPARERDRLHSLLRDRGVDGLAAKELEAAYRNEYGEKFNLKSSTNTNVSISDATEAVGAVAILMKGARRLLLPEFVPPGNTLAASGIRKPITNNFIFCTYFYLFCCLKANSLLATVLYLQLARILLCSRLVCRSEARHPFSPRPAGSLPGFIVSYDCILSDGDGMAPS